MFVEFIHMTWEEMCRKYPNMWVYTTNTQYGDNEIIVEGDVVAITTHSECDEVLKYVTELGIPICARFTDTSAVELPF